MIKKILILTLIIVISIMFSSRIEHFSNGMCKNMLLMNPVWAYWMNVMDFWGKSMTGNINNNGFQVDPFTGMMLM